MIRHFVWILILKDELLYGLYYHLQRPNLCDNNSLSPKTAEMFDNFLTSRNTRSCIDDWIVTFVGTSFKLHLIDKLFGKELCKICQIFMIWVDFVIIDFCSFINKTIFVIIFAGDCVQEFEQRPMNKSVIEGQNVMLECSVRDLAGDLQWSKGGIMLGNNFWSMFPRERFFFIDRSLNAKVGMSHTAH